MEGHTSEQLLRYIELSGENSNIDAKGPMSWDNKVTFASLAKDIVSFANSPDGGVIVIGKPEINPGEFELKGLSGEQAKSFETTKMANWINNYFSPPVHLVCHIQPYKNTKFVIITISEFKDIPILCIKSVQDPNNSKKHLIKERTIYVRNANAESAPLGSVEELRTLIGLATSKRGNEMLSMFESMLKGKPLVRVPSAEEHFEEELGRIYTGLEEILQNNMKSGGWNIVVHPSTYTADRWDENEYLESLVHRRSVRIRKEFPPSTTGTHPREWGICNNYYGDIWTLARSGLFAYWKPYWENRMKYQCQWQDAQGNPAEPDIDPGGWLDFESNVYLMIEMFMFMVRFVEEFEPGEELTFELRADSLAGRKLISKDPHISSGFLADKPCQAHVFEIKKQLSVEDFRTNWENICAATMKRFFEYFPGHHYEIEAMIKWVEKFKARNF